MAVTLKIDICPSGDCKSFNFTETTGAYNADYNSTGWGSPNDTFNPDWNTTLTISDPDDIETILDMSTYGFPTDNTNFTFPISASLLTNNTTGTLADGIYNFTYTTTNPAGTVTYTTTTSLYNYCNIQCCVYKMMADIDNPGCDCETAAMEAAIKAYNLLQGLKYAASCGLTDSFNELYNVLSRLCNNSGCRTCK
jgi:hypothetical protein